MSIRYVAKFLPRILIKQANFYAFFGNFGKILMDDHKLVMIVVTHFWTPRARDGVYLF
jgi:hypothetical protein